jgi:hypothetical protein
VAASAAESVRPTLSHGIILECRPALALGLIFPPISQVVRRGSSRHQEDQGLLPVVAAKRCSLDVSQVIFFAKDANLQMLSKAAQYVIKNESGLWLVVVHFFDDEHSPMLQELANNISVLVK